MAHNELHLLEVLVADMLLTGMVVTTEETVVTVILMVLMLMILEVLPKKTVLL